MTPPRLDGLVLAAGASRRFGSPKQLALIDGVPMLQRVIETLREALRLEGYYQDDSATIRLNKPPMTIVLGAHAEAVLEGVIEQLAPPHPAVLVCPDWEHGMAHSLRFGLAALEAVGPDAPNAALVLLADAPYITTDDLRRLIDAWQVSPDVPAAAQYAETVGAPCVLPRAVWPELETLEGDRGAGAWLKTRLAANSPLTLVAMPRAAHDVDRPLFMD